MSLTMSHSALALQQVESLRRQPGVKVISGIANFDWNSIERVIRAANQTQATFVDMACDKALVKRAQALSTVPLMVSSVDPFALVEATQWGVQAVEVGNFDALYDLGTFITAEEVLNITKTVLGLVSETVVVSATVPGHLSYGAQIYLAQHLEQAGVHLIQTEGAPPVVSLDRVVQSVSAAEKAARTIENTRILSQSVSCPVIAASGIDASNAALAIEAGAAAVGLGSAVNKLASVEAMVQVMVDVQHALAGVRSAQSAKTPMAQAI